MATPTKIKAELKSITAFADDVFKLDFVVPRKYTRFKAGQFLHLTLEDFDPTQAYWPESRVFSLCSAPKTEEVSIIYSVKGAYTARMRDELVVGNDYWLKLPYGDFIIEQLVPNRSTAVLIAGGTGISPYVSYLEEGLKSGFNRNVYLAYAVRSEDRLAFESVLERLCRIDDLSMRIWSEEAPIQPSLVTDSGQLDLDSVVKETRSLSDPHYLLSGPPQMLEVFSQELQAKHGVPTEKIHIDEWE